MILFREFWLKILFSIDSYYCNIIFYRIKLKNFDSFYKFSLDLEIVYKFSFEIENFYKISIEINFSLAIS